jgi:predicted glutamine amidotransferase
MCNLNIFLKTHKYCETKDDVTALTGFLQSVTANSYSSNNHGDGIFFSSGKLSKGLGKVNILPFAKDVQKSDFIISHQRLSTSGLPEDVHPFMFGDFVMAHNGVIPTYARGEHSDSYNLFKELEENFQALISHPATTRQDALVSAIKSIFNNIYASNSYSIAIYDIVDKVMYYFKNSGRYINLYASANAIYMTTNGGNEEYMTMIKEDFQPADLVALKVYKFVVGEAITYETVGDITPKPYVYSNFNYGAYGGEYPTDDDGHFQQRGSCSNLQTRLLSSPPTNLVDSDGDDDPNVRGVKALFSDCGMSETAALSDYKEAYDEELEEYKEGGFKKCSRHKKCAYCNELTRYITKKTGIRTCENCMVEQLVLDATGER